MSDLEQVLPSLGLSFAIWKVERMLAALQSCGKDQMLSGCGCSPRSGSLEIRLRVWGNKEHMVLGEGLSSKQSQPQQLEGRFPQLNSMLPPSGKIWVLQEIGVDEIAKGPELEEASKGVLFGPLWTRFADAQGREVLTSRSLRVEAWTEIGFQSRVLPGSHVVHRKPPRGLRAREVEL